MVSPLLFTEGEGVADALVLLGAAWRWPWCLWAAVVLLAVVLEVADCAAVWLDAVAA
jgi:hypothetical protein